MTSKVKLSFWYKTRTTPVVSENLGPRAISFQVFASYYPCHSETSPVRQSIYLKKMVECVVSVCKTYAMYKDLQVFK